jgi:peptidoglycan/xylan/chitin deacetylase (PgdA/CDA1 family)
VRAVITYHSIDPSGSAISISEAEFRRHVRWMATSGVTVVSLGELLTLPADANAIALTFDDAFQSFREVALDLLSEQGFPSTLFVVSGKVGGINSWELASASSLPVLPLLDWSGIADAAAAGVELGSHGRTHRALTALGRDELDAEVRGSLEDFRRELGMSPTAFCYPYGEVTIRERDAVAGLYRLAVTTELRAVVSEDDQYKVPRVDAYYLRGRGRLESFGTPAFERYLKVRRRGRRLRSSMVRLLGGRHE